MRPRTCPNCQIQIPLDGIEFDKNLNAICPKCKKIAFLTQKVKEAITIRETFLKKIT